MFKTDGLRQLHSTLRVGERYGVDLFARCELDAPTLASEAPRSPHLEALAGIARRASERSWASRNLAVGGVLAPAVQSKRRPIRQLHDEFCRLTAGNRALVMDALEQGEPGVYALFEILAKSDYATLDCLQRFVVHFVQTLEGDDPRRGLVAALLLALLGSYASATSYRADDAFASSCTSIATRPGSPHGPPRGAGERTELIREAVSAAA